ncbi:MAG TPA: hypothetical protein VIQ11_11250 [Mycobacterium sp.]
MASRRFSPGDITAGDGRPHRYRLIVLAGGVADVVESAGGFLCDRARAGWEVSVHLTGGVDARPLAILGITTHEPDADFASVIGSSSRGAVLAVGAGLLARDAAIRDDVSRMVVHGLTEVTVWGRPGPGGIGRGLEPATHPLSAAARAFKAQALLAAGSDALDTGTVAADEMLFRLRGRPRLLHSV